MTDTLSNFPLFSSRAKSSKEPAPAEEDETRERTEEEEQPPVRSQETSFTSNRTAMEEAGQEADLKVVEEEVQLHRARDIKRK